jgi:gluconolactonase
MFNVKIYSHKNILIMQKIYFLLMIAFCIFSCKNKEKEVSAEPAKSASTEAANGTKTTGVFIRTPSLDSIISTSAKAEIIADSFDWSEGPIWFDKEQMLIFSDVPTNTIYKWTEAKGKEIYLRPSGYTGAVERTGEMGSNGLTLDLKGDLVLCQHGDRRVARMLRPISDPQAKYATVAGNYNGKKFNSPNDATFDSNGNLFFTDPPYGLPKQMEDPTKETKYQGVYKVKPDGKVILLVDSITRPNGIAFFPGEKQILIANSDPDKPNWYKYDVEGDKLTNGKIFYSTKGYDKNMNGLPDGLKIDKKGNVYATGPGGVYFFDKNGTKLGMLKLDNATSNCALSGDQKTLYITNDMNILRLKM